jgi:uncharacterized protein (TIGR01589 family)
MIDIQVQHLIEKCICYKLNKEECMETLEKHAKIMPVITSTGMLAASCMHACFFFSLSHFY